MSLTLVGHALSCLVAHSSHARLSATRRAGAAPDRPECGVGLQQPLDGWIFPLAGHILGGRLNVADEPSTRPGTQRDLA
jgi:hypothetical protein